MSIIKDDCFNVVDGLMELSDALGLIKSRTTNVCGVEDIPLSDGLGRILAEDIKSSVNVPPHNNSAMDGYAVFADDLSATEPTRLPVSGRIAAGHPLPRPAKPGEALRIFTGAPLPPGLNGNGPDSVVMQEKVTVEGDGDMAVFPPGVKSGDNCRKMGEDVKSGDIILRSGQMLRAQEIGLGAAVGQTTVKVYKRLRAGVFSTGDEITDASNAELKPGSIYDANRPTVIALLKGLGCEVTDLGILPDDPGTIRSALKKAAGNNDVLLTSGGVSVGDEDHVANILKDMGSLHFWRLRVKPGKPVALGTIDGAAFVGLPGNPVSAMVTLMMVARPMILLMSGRSDIDVPRYLAQADFSLERRAGRLEWMRGNLEPGNDGPALVNIFSSQGSGILSSMVAANGFVEIPADTTSIKKGDMLNFIPFNEAFR